MNTNANLKCPKCDSQAEIAVRATAWFNVQEESGALSIEDDGGEPSFDGDDPATCRTCGHFGEVSDFMPKVETVTEPVQPIAAKATLVHFGFVDDDNTVEQFSSMVSEDDLIRQMAEHVAGMLTLNDDGIVISVDGDGDNYYVGFTPSQVLEQAGCGWKYDTITI